MTDDEAHDVIRKDVEYIRSRVDKLYTDVHSIDSKLSGFMGKAAGISAAIAFAISAAGLIISVIF